MEVKSEHPLTHNDSTKGFGVGLLVLWAIRSKKHVYQNWICEIHKMCFFFFSCIIYIFAYTAEDFLNFSSLPHLCLLLELNQRDREVGICVTHKHSCPFGNK